MLKPEEWTALLRDIADVAAEDFWDGFGFHATGGLTDAQADMAIELLVRQVENALRLKLLLIRAEHTQVATQLGLRLTDESEDTDGQSA